MSTYRKSAGAEELRTVIDRALPQRPLKVAREPLVEALVERIETWLSLAQQTKPYADKIARATAIADSMQRALEKAAYALERLGAVKDIERAKVLAQNLGIDSDHPPLAGQSAVLDLYLPVWQAQDQIRGWNRIYRRGRGNPGAFRSELTRALEELCHQKAGMSLYEFDDFLVTLAHIQGIPKLTREGVRKRKQRKKKRLGTK